MNEIIDFCRQNLVLIVSIATLVAEIIFVIIKRRPKTLDDFIFALNEVRSSISLLVERVEVPGNGSEKKQSVIDGALTVLSRLLGRELSEKEKVYAVKLFDVDIENVLSAPTKKEKKDEK